MTTRDSGGRCGAPEPFGVRLCGDRPLHAPAGRPHGVAPTCSSTDTRIQARRSPRFLCGAAATAYARQRSTCGVGWIVARGRVGSWVSTRARERVPEIRETTGLPEERRGEMPGERKPKSTWPCDGRRPARGLHAFYLPSPDGIASRGGRVRSARIGGTRKLAAPDSCVVIRSWKVPGNDCQRALQEMLKPAWPSPAGSKQAARAAAVTFRRPFRGSLVRYEAM
eukprot:352625-Chlamydomonas_euryale.AAC.3